MKFNFKKFFGEHDNKVGAPDKKAQELLDRLGVATKGTIAEKLAEQYVAGVNDGLYQVTPCVDEPKKATETVAFAMLTRNVVAMGQGQAIQRFQFSVLSDPFDGPGAAQPASVQDFIIDTTTVGTAQAVLLGMATQWGNETGFQKLRGTVAVMQSAPDNVISVYVWRELDGQLKSGWMVFEKGKSETMRVSYDTTGSEMVKVMTAMFTVNDLIAPIHPKFRKK